MAFCYYRRAADKPSKIAAPRLPLHSVSNIAVEKTRCSVSVSKKRNAMQCLESLNSTKPLLINIGKIIVAAAHAVRPYLLEPENESIVTYSSSFAHFFPETLSVDVVGLTSFHLLVGPSIVNGKDGDSSDDWEDRELTMFNGCCCHCFSGGGVPGTNSVDPVMPWCRLFPAVKLRFKFSATSFC